MHDAHLVCDSNLSLVCAKAVRLVVQRGQQEVRPLVARWEIHPEAGLVERDGIRQALDRLLIARGERNCHTVANTIFPAHLWDRNQPPDRLFERYQRVLPRLKRMEPANRLGLYFERMVTGGRIDEPNQLRFMLNCFLQQGNIRRSALQITIFRASKDHSRARRRGFPCMQHLSFAPDAARTSIAVNAFYATQSIDIKLYGNLLGLARLGSFVAHSIGLRLDSVNCFAGIAYRGIPIRHLEAVCQLFPAGLDAG